MVRDARTRPLVAWAAGLLGVLGAACGGGPPSANQIWHEASLRPGEVSPETHGEREFLIRLADVPAGQPVAFGSQVFVADAPYFAASGRTCRPVTVRPREPDGQVDFRLACEERDGWVFVPDPFADAAVRVASGGGAAATGRRP